MFLPVRLFGLCLIWAAVAAGIRALERALWGFDPASAAHWAALGQAWRDGNLIIDSLDELLLVLSWPFFVILLVVTPVLAWHPAGVLAGLLRSSTVPNPPNPPAGGPEPSKPSEAVEDLVAGYVRTLREAVSLEAEAEAETPPDPPPMALQPADGIARTIARLLRLGYHGAFRQAVPVGGGTADLVVAANGTITVIQVWQVPEEVTDQGPIWLTSDGNGVPSPVIAARRLCLALQAACEDRLAAAGIPATFRPVLVVAAGTIANANGIAEAWRGVDVCGLSRDSGLTSPDLVLGKCLAPMAGALDRLPS